MSKKFSEIYEEIIKDSQEFVCEDGTVLEVPKALINEAFWQRAVKSKLSKDALKELIKHYSVYHNKTNLNNLSKSNDSLNDFIKDLKTDKFEKSRLEKLKTAGIIPTSELGEFILSFVGPSIQSMKGRAIPYNEACNEIINESSMEDFEKELTTPTNAKIINSLPHSHRVMEFLRRAIQKCVGDGVYSKVFDKVQPEHISMIVQYIKDEEALRSKTRVEKYPSIKSIWDYQSSQSNIFMEGFIEEAFMFINNYIKAGRRAPLTLEVLKKFVNEWVDDMNNSSSKGTTHPKFDI